jgi:hypothetical protein
MRHLRLRTHGICLDCPIVVVKMRLRMLGAVAGGILAVVVSSADASAAAVEKDDDVAVALPVEPGVSETGIRDEAMMVLVGSALIGAAAAVRRAA